MTDTNKRWADCSSSSDEDEGLDKSSVIFAKRNKSRSRETPPAGGASKIEGIGPHQQLQQQQQQQQQRKVIPKQPQHSSKLQKQWGRPSGEKQDEYVDWKALARNSSKILHVDSSRSTMERPRSQEQASTSSWIEKRQMKEHQRIQEEMIKAQHMSKTLEEEKKSRLKQQMAGLKAALSSIQRDRMSEPLTAATDAAVLEEGSRQRGASFHETAAEPSFSRQHPEKAAQELQTEPLHHHQQQQQQRAHNHHVPHKQQQRQPIKILSKPPQVTSPPSSSALPVLPLETVVPLPSTKPMLIEEDVPSDNVQSVDILVADESNKNNNTESSGNEKRFNIRQLNKTERSKGKPQVQSRRPEVDSKKEGHEGKLDTEIPIKNDAKHLAKTKENRKIDAVHKKSIHEIDDEDFTVRIVMPDGKEITQLASRSTTTKKRTSPNPSIPAKSQPQNPQNDALAAPRHKNELLKAAPKPQKVAHNKQLESKQQHLREEVQEDSKIKELKLTPQEELKKEQLHSTTEPLQQNISSSMQKLALVEKETTSDTAPPQKTSLQASLEEVKRPPTVKSNAVIAELDPYGKSVVFSRKTTGGNMSRAGPFDSLSRGHPSGGRPARGGNRSGRVNGRSRETKPAMSEVNKDANEILPQNFASSAALSADVVDKRMESNRQTSNTDTVEKDTSATRPRLESNDDKIEIKQASNERRLHPNKKRSKDGGRTNRGGFTSRGGGRGNARPKDRNAVGEISSKQGSEHNE